MTAAERWATEHGFASPSVFRNARDELLADLLDAEPTVRHSGVVHERWNFEDGSSVVLKFVTWELEH
jgi:hypothetical protein